MKECTQCHIIKPRSEFYRHPRATDGYNSWCKQCMKERAAAKRHVGVIYYVQVQVYQNPIKVGMTTADNLYARLSSIKTNNAYPVRLVGLENAVLPAVREAEVHDMFDHLRISGEWFLPTPEFVAWVKSVGIEDVDGFDPTPWM